VIQNFEGHEINSSPLIFHGDLRNANYRALAADTPVINPRNFTINLVFVLYGRSQEITRSKPSRTEPTAAPTTLPREVENPSPFHARAKFAAGI
jgi:hypothetical protein